MPRVIFVVAHDRRGIMGRGGALPWHLPADLKHFKTITMGKPVIMGRKTFDSIGKPLPGRRNIVITRNPQYAPAGVEIARSAGEALSMTAGEPEVAVIGGAQIFEAFAPVVQSAYVTHVDAQVEGDVRYSAPARPSRSMEIGAHPADERNAFAMRFERVDYENAAVTGGSLNESKPSL